MRVFIGNGDKQVELAGIQGFTMRAEPIIPEQYRAVEIPRNWLTATLSFTFTYHDPFYSGIGPTLDYKLRTIPMSRN